MNGKRIVGLFFLVTLIAGCSSGNALEEEVVVSILPAGEASEEMTAESIFLRYDAVRNVLYEWNAAIDSHRTFELEKLYAKKVRYYSKMTDRQEVIHQKNEWLKQHKFYAQQLGHCEIYYDDSDTLGLEFTASFIKICIEKTKQTEVESFLTFRKFGNEWKIIEETDGPTEVNAAKMKPVHTLPDGSYRYYLGYWSDTRDIPRFAQDMAPYSSTLEFEITEKGITGVYDDYSGTMRSRTHYLVKSGKIVDGILELYVVYSPVENPSPKDLEGTEETQTWRFKILANQQLTCLSKENVTLYSRTLRRIE